LVSFCQKYLVRHDLRAIKIGFVLPKSNVLIRHAPNDCRAMPQQIGFVLPK